MLNLPWTASSILGTLRYLVGQTVFIGAVVAVTSSHVPAQVAVYGYDDAGSLICIGDSSVDPSNCGGRGVVCSANHISPLCVAGHCAGDCAPEFADCNGNKQSDGCEVSLLEDVAHCAACGHACSSNHIPSPECNAGVCGGDCEQGYADCNTQLGAQDGCEVNLMTSTLNCGACWQACSANHVTPLCVSGACAGSCEGGYADCNGDKLTDGCETLANTASMCGGCGAAYACSSNHVTPACTAGVCSGACASGWGDCNANKRADGCETALTSVSNCGQCGLACSTNHITASCTAGLCSGTCASGWADCNGNKASDGCESSLGSTTNCGGCGVVCSSNHVSATCTGGVCGGTCSAGWADCNGDKRSDGCEASLATPTNCGGCGNTCSTNHISASCTTGTCDGACSAGWADCNANKMTDGCETATTSVSSCGGCGVVCSTNHVTASCTAGTCNGACLAGWYDCNGNKQTDGCEATLTTVTNCGACGKSCSNNHIASPTCSNGACGGTCSAGWADCNGNKQTDGCEASLSTVANCGACGRACTGGNECRSGRCVDPNDLCAGVNCGTLVCNPDTGACVKFIP